MIVNRVFAVALCAAAVFVSPVSAQQAAAPSASHLAIAKEVVLSSGITRTFEVFLPQLANQTVLTVTRTRPEVREDLLAVLKQVLPEFEKRKGEMVDVTARAFAGAMSESELKDTAAFFKTEAGRKYVEVQPKVIDQMVVALDAWNRQMSIDLMSRVREEMRKKGHSL